MIKFQLTVGFAAAACFAAVMLTAVDSAANQAAIIGFWACAAAISAFKRSSRA